MKHSAPLHRADSVFIPQKGVGKPGARDLRPVLGTVYVRTVTGFLWAYCCAQTAEAKNATGECGLVCLHSYFQVPMTLLAWWGE